MGKPNFAISEISPVEWRDSIPAEVKHLSKRRKKKTNVYSLSSGERKGKSLDRAYNLLCASKLIRERRSKAFVLSENFGRSEKIDG